MRESAAARNTTSGTESHVVGDTGATFVVLADAISAVQSFVSVFIWVYTLLIFAYVIASWIRSPYTTHPLMRFLHDVCDPYLGLFRRVVPPLGPVDLSPIVAIGFLYLVQWLVVTVLLERLQ